MKQKLAALLFAATAILIASCSGSNQKKIAGAGATFPLPFYNMAFQTYQKSTDISVTYGGIGSGGGIRSLTDKIVDFAGSDAYLSEKEMREMDAKVLHIPSCLGAVVLAYNLPGIENLNLDGEIIADIYLGKITSWDDARIIKLNPEKKLPKMPINPVYRSDGSGTTFVFSDYLTKVSNEWADKMGVSKSLNWNVGVASKGNPGVAGTIKSTVGSIGYIGSEYSFALKIPVANLKNSSGNIVEPTLASISASASGEIPEDMRFMITNSNAADAYPISCFTWLLVYAEQGYDERTLEQAQITVNLIKWMISKEAQDLTSKVHYAPLPKKVEVMAMDALKKITYNGETINER